MSFKRLLIFVSEWLAANALFLLAAGDITAFVRDQRGAALLIVLNLLWLVPVVGVVIEPEDRIKVRVKEYCHHLWMGVMFLELAAAGYEYSHYRMAHNSVTPFETGVGFVLICLGFVVSFIAWLSIRKYVAPQFQIVENHEVVDNGLYRYVRHPIYTGFFLIAVGVPVFIRGIAALVLLALIIIPVWMYVINQEEEFLLAELGNDYEMYIKRTKRLIPYIY